MMDASKKGTKSPKARPSDIEIVIFMSDGQSTPWLGNLICQPVFPVDPKFSFFLVQREAIVDITGTLKKPNPIA